MKIKIRTVVRAPVREVWRAWTTPEDIVAQREGWQAILESFRRHVESKAR